MSEVCPILEIQQRKATQMNVAITWANGNTLNPVFEPSHKDSLIAFYTAMLNEPQATPVSVRITDDNGELVFFGSAS
jgi:hypothetical protein